MTGDRLTSAIARFAADERARLIELRRALHAEPELSWQERRTQARLRDALIACGVTRIADVAGTGLVARIPGTRPGAPVVALRGDIDALPITEATGLPFASTVPGVMHACGHDMHATWAVAAAMLLVRAPAEGEVRIVLQPAEEVGEGATKVLESGALDGVSAIFGAHVDWRFKVGEVVATAGPLAASTDTFEIDFHGRGGHGARPQDAVDPIVGLAAFIGDLQTVVSRILDPALPGVITVGMVQAGNASNVIPESARCSGTIRATTPAARALLGGELTRLAHSVAGTYRLTATVTLSEGTPPLVNTVRGAAWAQQAVRDVLGDAALRSLPTTNMGGEDFAYYLEGMEGCFMRVGTFAEDRSPAGVHTPRFDPDESALFVAGGVLAACARRACEG